MNRFFLMMKLIFRLEAYLDPLKKKL